MPIKVFAWPPVGAIGAEWTSHQPVARMRSILTGRDQMQASQRRRRLATVQVSALCADRSGAGYCEMLKQFLEGGIHAVRLRSSPINWHLDELRREALLNSSPISWLNGSTEFSWSSESAFAWFATNPAVAVGLSGGGIWNDLQVTGLPANKLVARTGDFIRAYDVADSNITQVARVVRPAVTNSAGTVLLRLDRAITIANARINMAGQDEAVFRVSGDLPRAVQPVGKNWSYTWSFREVFSDEVGGFEEIDPWN